MLLSRVILAILAAGTLDATTYTFTNVFPNDGHLIGDPGSFAIQKVIIGVTATQVQVTIDSNYENGTLSPFTYAGPNKTYTVEIGDFFFTSAGNLAFGVPIESHGYNDACNNAATCSPLGNQNNTGITGNDVLNTNLYRINNLTTGTLTSDAMMNSAGDISFNSGKTVFLHDNGANSLTAYSGASTGPGMSLLGNGTTQAKYQISFTITRPTLASDPFNLLLNSDSWGFYFASADCANDYLAGQVPEPGSLWLLGLGIAGIALKRRLRAR